MFLIFWYEVCNNDSLNRPFFGGPACQKGQLRGTAGGGYSALDETIIKRMPQAGKILSIGDW